MMQPHLIQELYKPSFYKRWLYNLILTAFALMVSTYSYSEAFRLLASPFPTNIPPYAWQDNCSNQYIGAIPAAAAKAAKAAGLDLEIYRFNRYKPGLVDFMARSIVNNQFDAVMYSEVKQAPWGQLSRGENYISKFEISAVVNKRKNINIMQREDMQTMTAYVQEVRANSKVIQTLKAEDLPHLLSTRIDQAMLEIVSKPDHYVLLSDFNARSAILKDKKLSPYLEVVKLADFDFNNYLHLYAHSKKKIDDFKKLDKALGNIYRKGYWEFITEEYFKKWLSIDSCDYNVGASQAYRVITLDIDDYLK